MNIKHDDPNLEMEGLVPFGSYMECQECGSKVDVGIFNSQGALLTSCHQFIDNGCPEPREKFILVKPGDESPFINKMHELYPEGFTLQMKTGKGFIIPVTFPPRSKGKTE